MLDEVRYTHIKYVRIPLRKLSSRYVPNRTTMRAINKNANDGRKMKTKTATLRMGENARQSPRRKEAEIVYILADCGDVRFNRLFVRADKSD